MSENGDTQYNNSNRAFLQAFLARSTLTYDEAKPILAAILTAHGNPPQRRLPSTSHEAYSHLLQKSAKPSPKT